MRRAGREPTGAVRCLTLRWAGLRCAPNVYVPQSGLFSSTSSRSVSASFFFWQAFSAALSASCASFPHASWFLFRRAGGGGGAGEGRAGRGRWRAGGEPPGAGQRRETKANAGKKIRGRGKPSKRDAPHRTNPRPEEGRERHCAPTYLFLLFVLEVPARARGDQRLGDLGVLGQVQRRVACGEETGREGTRPDQTTASGRRRIRTAQHASPCQARKVSGGGFDWF